MNVLIEILLTNAIIATVLALVVFLVTRRYKNCFAVHFLWLIVLVKLVTPPIWQIQIPVLTAQTSSVSSEVVQANHQQSELYAPATKTQVADSFVGHSPQAPERLPEDNFGSSDQAMVADGESIGAQSSTSFPGFPFGLTFWIAILWASGSLALLTITIVRLVAFDRSLRRTTVPNEIWQKRVEQLAKRIGLSRSPSVRTTEAKISPLIWCVRCNPVLVLPLQLVDSLDQKQSDQIIVHELAHLLRRSHCIRWFELFVTSVYWWNPVLWWTRNQLHQADEACCDSIVLRHYPNDFHDYGVSLFRSAEFLTLNSQQAPLAFNFSHFKFLKRRMQMVLKNELATSISKSSKSALALFACLVLIFSARAIAGSGAQSIQDSKNESTDSLTLFVVDPSCEPVEGASVTTKEGEAEKSFQTDAKGTCDIGYSGETPIGGLAITVQANGYVPMKSVWRSKSKQQLPDSLRFELQLPSTMGGIVVDPAGKPIEGVKISFKASTPSSSDTHIYSTSLGVNTTTEKNGRWKCVQVPPIEKLGVVWVDFTSDEHVYVLNRLEKPEWELLRDQTHKQTLRPGYRIRGRVTDAEGYPIFDAKCVAGRGYEFTPRQFTKTDMNGEYELTGIESGERYVTFLAKGYAPLMHKIAIVEKDAILNFQLAEGNPITIEVKDPAGNPVANASVTLEWKNSRSLQQLMMYHSPLTTGPDGIVKWDNAPAESINCIISATGFTTLQDRRLSPSNAPFQFVLYPPLKVTGTVVDKKTKAPIQNFNVIPGTKDSNGRFDWRQYSAFSGAKGKLIWAQKNSDAETYFRIEAEGQKDFVTQGMKQSEGAVELAVEMEPAGTRVVSLIGPDGNPVTQAKVFLCRKSNVGSGLDIRNGAKVDRENRQTKLTVRDSKFELPTDSTELNVMVFAEEGYGSIAAKDLENSNRIELLAWSRVEGIARMGAKPAVDQRIKIFMFHKFGATINYAAKTDNNGKFVFTRVPPDLVDPRIYREIIKYSEGGLTGTTAAFIQPITLKPGETTTVDLGGTGRAVIGKLVAPGDYDEPIAQWNRGTIKLERTITGPGGEVKKEFHGTVIQADGSFRFEDIPAGNYRFESTVEEASSHRWKDGPVIGSVYKNFVVEPMPGGRSDSPLDLGELTLR